MLFSSITFIYYFLPLLLICYFLFPKRIRNFVLLIFSLIFYFLGEPKYILVIIFSCILNYYFSKIIDKKIYPKLFLILAIIYNIGQLYIFKYTDFTIENINNLFNLNIQYIRIIMPIGISFYTFQTMSYVIDVYNKKHPVARNLFEFMTYVCLFPQLIAGPIVRYSDVRNQLTKRTESFDNFSEGIKRLVIGLSKKVLLANVLGELCNNLIQKTVLSSWIKAISYTLQIYFDFSGYSDMAIGLGLMFGFKFLENFNYPLIASSITDFWRRWHISLSSWFKDYVYIPLGGNRKGKIKWLRNLLIVWMLTGFWHGASWNFIIWGLYFGIILIIEKIFLQKYLEKTKVIKYIYTSVIVVISFMIFNSITTSEILTNIKDMFFISDIPLVNQETIYYIRNSIVLLIISIIASTPLIKNLINKVKTTKLSKIINLMEPVVYLILLTLTTAFLIDASFNPFLYFRF